MNHGLRNYLKIMAIYRKNTESNPIDVKPIGRRLMSRIISRIIEFAKFASAIIKDVYIYTFFKDNVSLMAAAISFYAVLSIIPLLLVFVSVAGYILNSSEKAFDDVTKFLLAIIPSSTTSIIAFLEDFMRKKEVFGALGIIGLIWAASRIFAAVENSVNAVWKVEDGRPFWKSKILSMILVPISILTLILSLMLTAIYAFASQRPVPIINISLSEIGLLSKMIQIVLPVIVSMVLFTLIYKFMPYRYVPLLSAIVGAFFAAVFWEVAKILFDVYISNYTDYSKVYGSFGTLVVAVFWIYYSAFILLLGAEIGWAFDERRKQSEFLNLFKNFD
ncbi:MAG: hypothetical protein CO189_09885 [candidate division Zixibacteria bacterium CG_4_9_14_3_um_filter_46_8]|nr:MAG: hypothetical protein CO189_09885 [candidate division Zixibacteria bacterium CG_4_9_14_3_um_filter_46_8]